MEIDLHTHSNVSDGTDTPTRLVLAAAEADLDVIALTDHDTFGGLVEAQEAGRRHGVRVLTGIEMSADRDGRSVHVLGYGCDVRDPGLLAELTRMREARRQRVPQMCARLRDLGVAITMDDVLMQARGAVSLGRPHVADVLVAAGVVGSRTEAFEQFLAEGRPAYVPRYATELGRAIDLLHAARGVAVLAHPWGRQSRSVLPAPYIEELVHLHGLDGIEVDHQDHDSHTRSLLFEMGARLGLVRTGSSDYHGAGKVDHELGCNLTRPTAYRELLARIRGRGGAVPR